ncbi:hypothetical protein AGMMS49545_18200 [Betaproteobacteria bacterium]|nr:hypothetical protein AGMMS49545_18200 [Betaproteobacteria bacterium]GHU45163.1 hypothetical protein AGMMS50289_15640 [Betaproteobacteria bacterium]
MSEQQGLFWSLRHLLGDLLEIGRTRLALLSNEAQEERLRLITILVSGFLALSSLVIGVVLLVIFLLLAFWESRLLIVGTACLAFLVAAAIFAWKTRAEIQNGPLLFSASLRELKRDIVSLRSRIKDQDEFPPA